MNNAIQEFEKVGFWNMDCVKKQMEVKQMENKTLELLDKIEKVMDEYGNEHINATILRKGLIDMVNNRS